MHLFIPCRYQSCIYNIYPCDIGNKPKNWSVSNVEVAVEVEGEEK